MKTSPARDRSDRDERKVCIRTHAVPAFHGATRSMLAGSQHASWAYIMGRPPFLALLFTCVLVAAGTMQCSPAPSSKPAAAPVAQPEAPTSLSSALTESPLVVELRAPRRARWVAATLGPMKPVLGVYVSNEGGADVDVSQLHVQLEAVREGVSFKCNADVGPSPNDREPAVLHPKSAFVFERALDCSLPLTGLYTVKVNVMFGREDKVVTRELRTFTLNVTAAEHVEPKPIEPLPGLWASIGGSNLMVGRSLKRPGIAPDEGSSGRIAVALINGSNRSIEIASPIRLALRVYRAGSPIPCVDEPIDVKAPRVLGPGAEHRVPIPVSCLGLERPGRYEVAASLLVGAVSDVKEVEIGRLAIEISTDPSRSAPMW